MKNINIKGITQCITIPYIGDIGKRITTIKERKFQIILYFYFLSFIVMMIVYSSGGTAKVYSNLMYLPIAIVSTICGKKQGVIHAIVSGLMIGPFMPLDASLNLYQQPINWIIRLFIYISIALIIGSFSDYNRRNREYITNLLTHDSITNFKNLDTIKQEDKLDGKDKTLIALSVKESEPLFSYFGYSFSNEIIVEFSRKLKEVLIEYDDIEFYRYYGMTFLIKVNHNPTNTNVEKVINLLDGLNKSIIMVRNIPIYLELRLGITDLGKNVSLLEGVRYALIALNDANTKDLKIKYFNPLLESNYKTKVDIASTFINALKKENIKAAYQYIYSSNNERIRGVELLTRWIKEDDTQIYPNEFIPVIENTELIHDLTRFTIDKALEFLLKNQYNSWMVSINFSSKQFSKDNIDYLIKKMSLNGIDPKRIQIEITERISVNKEYINTYLKILRNNGVSIAVDDFGVGYSSYKYLADMPINVVKIDKSLIKNINDNERDKKIVMSIINFCRETNIVTIAEGVETKDVADTCKKIGVDLIQGYYYHKPEIFHNS